MTSLATPLKVSPWTNVTTATNSGVASAIASVRWWSKSGVMVVMKGSITLQKKEGESAYRLTYDGKYHASEEGEVTGAFGALMLPSDCPWNVRLTKAASNNAKARLVALEFPSQSSTELARIQITIPFEGKGAVEKLFGEALIHTDQHCQHQPPKKKRAPANDTSIKTPKMKNKRKNLS